MFFPLKGFVAGRASRYYFGMSTEEEVEKEIEVLEAELREARSFGSCPLGATSADTRN